MPHIDKLKKEKEAYEVRAKLHLQHAKELEDRAQKVRADAHACSGAAQVLGILIAEAEEETKAQEKTEAP